MKQYNGEKAIISLTSWKARINTVGLTLFSLVKRCPGFHIVLVLSEEEFPKKEAELPDTVMAFVDQDLIEILWVYKNYKSFKKVLFTMDKYKDVPVISADDDLIYPINYAQVLYNVWKTHPTNCIGYTHSYRNNKYKTKILWGYAQLFPPRFSRLIDFKLLDVLLMKNCIDDDDFYAAIRHKYNVTPISLNIPYKSWIIPIKSINKSTSITSQRKSHTPDMTIYNALLGTNL